MSLGSIVVRLTMNTADFETDAGRAAKVADKRAKEIEGHFRKAGVVIGTALSAAAIGLTALTKSAIDNADAMRDLSIRLGVDTETLSAYGYAATQTGTDIEVMGKGLKVLAKNVADATNPTNEYAKVFAALGINVTDSEGKLRSLQELVPEIADKFKLLEDGTTKAALAQSLFGRAGLEMTEFLNSGADGLADYTEKARRLGVVVSQETADAADQFNDKLGDGKKLIEGLGLSIAKELLPDLDRMIDRFVGGSGAGDKLATTAHAIADGFRVMASAAESSITLVSSVAEVVAGLTMQLAGFYEIAASLGNLDFERRDKGAKLYRAGGERINAGADRLINPHGPNGLFSDPVTVPASAYTGQLLTPSQSVADAEFQAEVRRIKERQEYARKLAAALGNAPTPKGGGSKTPKLTDEQKEAQRLLDTYGDLVASQLEQIALFGATTEAARVRYATEHGDLKDLSQAQKDVLISNAEYQDQLADTAALEEVWADAAQEQTDRVIASWNSATDELSVFAEQAGRNMQDAFADFLFDPFEEGLDGMLEGFADILQRMMAEWLASQLFNSMGEWGKANSGGDGWMGTLATIVGKFFGGGRAGGGGVDGSKLYEVGEGGAPELFKQGSRTYLIPGNDGRVVPAVNSNFGAPPEGVGGGFKVVIENKGQPMRSTGAQMEAGANGMQQLRVFIEDVAAESVTRGGKVDRANRMAYGVQRQGYTSG